MKKALYTLLYCLVSFIATAQNENEFFYNPDEDQERQRPGNRRDSTVKDGPVVPHFRTAWQWVNGGLYKKYLPLDSLADGVHNYNVIFKRDVSNTYLGNFPSPYESNIFIHRERNQDFYPLNTVRAYLFKPEDALEWNVTTPFTRLDYFNGGSGDRSENWLDLWHVQNIRPYWSAGIRYNLISSNGSYSYQKSKTYHFSLFSSYERRRLIASFFVNQNMGHFNENGGIVDFSEIRDTIMSSRYVLTRINGEPSNNYQNFNLSLLLQYNIGKGTRPAASRDSTVAIVPSRDSLPGLPGLSRDSLPLVFVPDTLRRPPDSLALAAIDSLPPVPLVADTLPEEIMTYPLKATLSIRVEGNKHTFKEASVDRDFFPAFYIDSLAYNNRYRNDLVEVAGKLILNEHPRYGYLPGVHAGLTYKQLNYRQRMQVDRDSSTNDFGTTTYANLYLTAGIFNVDTADLFHFDASGSLCLIGDYIADYSLQGEITQFLRRDRSAYLKLKGTLQRVSPNPFLEFYIGNHDRWENHFGKTGVQEIQGSLHHDRYRSETGVALRNTTGYISLDTLASPRQHDASLLVLTAWVKQAFVLGHFTLDQTVYYQLVNSPGTLSLPRVALYSHNYYQNTFFKKALGFQVGVDLFYNTAFRASAYAPSTMQFRDQHEGMTGNYPKLDLFLALRVKRADIFIKYEHASQYIANRDYFSAYAYPINPARIKYGVRWNFFD
ncbi:MAG: putative porin [Odoribacteraceae bacterium]|jgi:hypothetical protein|nr:putative porin [Odoribacteraceae bacterium]